MSEEEKSVVEQPVEEVAVEEKDEMKAVLADPNAPIITVKKLLEAGVHFGHQTRRWNPKMKPYIYTARNGIYIIDLQKTVAKVNESYEALKKIVVDSGKVIFVGTKKQCQDIVKKEALRSGSFYVASRWLGGTLTNFRTIQKRIKFLKDIEVMESDGTFARLPKKEVAQYYKQKEKLEKSLGGIKEMRRLPQAIVVIDPKIEFNAVKEARKLRIPVFGIVDTNSDPDLVDYVIPANDDATKSVDLLISVLADAVVEAKGGQTTVAHIVDEGEEATMDDVIKNADKVEELRQKAKREAFQQRKQQFQNRRFNNNGPRKPFQKREEIKGEDLKAVKTDAVKSEEIKAPAKKVEEVKAEVKVEEKPVEKKPAAKKPAAKKEVAEEKPAEKKPAAKKATAKKEEAAEEKPAEKKPAAKKAAAKKTAE